MMPVQLLAPAAFDRTGPQFFGYQVLSDCTLHVNGTAECRGTNCEAGYGNRHAGPPPGYPGPAAAAMIRCELFAAIPFAGSPGPRPYPAASMPSMRCSTT